jgi:hypothetical protein
MFKSMVGVTLAFLSASAFAVGSSYSCKVNVPNGSWPDNGPERVDLFHLIDIASPVPGSSVVNWVPFINLDSNFPEKLEVVSVTTMRCPNCFDVIAKKDNGNAHDFFKVSIREKLRPRGVRAIAVNVDYRTDSPAGPTKWISFNEKPGVCTALSN